MRMILVAEIASQYLLNEGLFRPPYDIASARLRAVMMIDAELMREERWYHQIRISRYKRRRDDDAYY